MDEKLAGAEIAALMSLIVALIGVGANFLITRLMSACPPGLREETLSSS